MKVLKLKHKLKIPVDKAVWNTFHSRSRSFSSYSASVSEVILDFYIKNDNLITKTRNFGNSLDLILSFLTDK